MRFSNISIGNKILALCLCFCIILPIVVGSVAYVVASDVLYQDTKTTLLNQVTSSKSLSADYQTINQDAVAKNLKALSRYFYNVGQPEIVDGNLVLTKDGSKMVLNDNNDIVDEIQNAVGGAAIIFQKIGNDAIRISTNIKKEDGTRAVGTALSPEVYEIVVNKGETYYGTADILGKRYITAYEPIKDKSGSIIGVLFAGVLEDDVMGPLKEQIRKTVVGETGYMYVMNSEGILVIHPKQEGESVAQYAFIQEMLKTKEGFN